jgi:hypothetical protein
MGFKSFLSNRITVLPLIQNFRFRIRPNADFINDVPIADWDVLQSSSNLENFWDNAHKSDNSFWTSGTDYLEVKNIFELPDNFENKKVLIVGVGQGTELNGVLESGGIVSGLDISEIARMKWGSIAPMFSWSSLKGDFDYILMHLVAQHLSDTTCSEYLETLSNHLMPGGRLVIQYASPLGLVPESSSDNIENLKGGGYTRSLEKIFGLYQSTNQHIIASRISNVYPKNNCVYIVVTSSAG